MSDEKAVLEFTASAPLTLGVELELQLLSPRDFDLTRGATDLLGSIGSVDYDDRFGDIKLEVTESMIEVSTQARSAVDEIAADLDGLHGVLLRQCARNNIAICGGGTHPFHSWPERRICPGERYAQTYDRYGYLAKQFTVFGQHIHVGCASADDAIWLTQALCPFVPFFIALSASSPFVDGVDTFFQSARLNAVSAFPLSGQCPEMRDWAHFTQYYELLDDCGIIRSIKDLYWDVRPKPEYGTVEIRVCDTPLDIAQASALAAFAQCLARHLLRKRPPYNAGLHLHVARYNKFQACRYGLGAQLSSPANRAQEPLRDALAELLDDLAEDAAALGCTRWLDQLRWPFEGVPSAADWLRERYAERRNLNDVVRESSLRFARKSTGEAVSPQ